MCHDPERFRLRREYFFKLIDKFNILCIQEVHGDHAAMEHYMHPLAQTHTYFYSPGPDYGSGGILLVVNNDILHNATGPPQFLTFEEGRLINVFVAFPSGNFSI